MKRERERLASVDFQTFPASNPGCLWLPCWVSPNMVNAHTLTKHVLVIPIPYDHLNPAEASAAIYVSLFASADLHLFNTVWHWGQSTGDDSSEICGRKDAGRCLFNWIRLLWMQQWPAHRTPVIVLSLHHGAKDHTANNYYKSSSSKSEWAGFIVRLNGFSWMSAYDLPRGCYAFTMCFIGWCYKQQNKEIQIEGCRRLHTLQVGHNWCMIRIHFVRVCTLCFRKIPLFILKKRSRSH